MSQSVELAAKDPAPSVPADASRHGERMDRVQGAITACLQAPLEENALTSLQFAIDELLEAIPGAVRAYQQRRAHQARELGGYSQRYVLIKDFDANDQLVPLAPPRPGRDGVRGHLARIATQHPQLFPGGLAAYLERERPLVQATTPDFERVLETYARAESENLRAAKPGALVMKLVDLVDTLSAYQNVSRLIAEAHPTAIEHIDRGDVAGMIEFLVGIGRRTPLSDAEFRRFVELSQQGWENCPESDLVLRGRVVSVGLDGKAPVLRKWITPFVRSLAAAGRVPELLGRLHPRSTAPRTPPPQDVTRTTAPLPRPEPVSSPPPGVSDSGRFVVPVNTPEPAKLNVLRNYLRCGSMSATVALDHALQMAAAQPDVPGHRQHVLRVFQEEGWLMEPRGKREPIFKRRPAAPPGLVDPANSGV